MKARWAVRRLLFPHPAALLVMDGVAVAALMYSLGNAAALPLVCYLSYGFSFYALVATVACLPAAVRRGKQRALANRYVAALAGDVHLRTRLSLYGAFAFHGAYAVFQLGLGILHHATWFYVMAAYNLQLALMRLPLARHMRYHVSGEDTRTEWREFRLCGVCLLMMTWVLSVMIVFFVRQLKGVHHHPITTITMAAYTFTALVLATVQAIRFRRQGSPVYAAAKIATLASASVSMLPLENAMLYTFGGGKNPAFDRWMLGVTGAVVVLLIQGMAIWMIGKATRVLRKEIEEGTHDA